MASEGKVASGADIASIVDVSANLATAYRDFQDHKADTGAQRALVDNAAGLAAAVATTLSANPALQTVASSFNIVSNLDLYQLDKEAYDQAVENSDVQAQVNAALALARTMLMVRSVDWLARWPPLGS